MTIKKRAFVSYDLDHDEDAKIKLAEQARLPDSPFEIIDTSVKGPLTDDWREKVRLRMGNIDVVIALCGEHAFLAKGMAVELTIAQEKNTPYFLLMAYAHRTCTKPTPAMSSDKIYEWTWDNLKTLIGGWR
jgi:3'-phosphoadenosine 5'-phosphosulfate sulfotransferase (PAPS reductase)/FAD synthetase